MPALRRASASSRSFPGPRALPARYRDCLVSRLQLISSSAMRPRKLVTESRDRRQACSASALPILFVNLDRFVDLKLN